MKSISVQNIRIAVGGRALSQIPGDSALVTSVCTDSRRMAPGSLFIPLRGETYDGHAFLSDAAGAGAVAALVEDVPSQSFPNLHLIQVANTRKAMHKLATHLRKQMQCKVIGVAGSNGKTSTKYLIHAALSAKKRGTMSQKNWNNDIGVPITIFAADPNHDYLVLEMGTNHPGEIRVLTDMALPDVAVITNVGAEHLEFLGDLMGVRRENASVISGLNPKGLLIFNGDDPELRAAVAGFPGKTITFGFDPKNDLFANDIRCDTTGVRFFLNNSRREVFLPLLGRHNACNALAAIAAARWMRLDEDEIIEALADAKGPDMRLELTQVGQLTVLNDAYNANPNSMRAALETIANLSIAGRRIAVLGDMRELGHSADRYHREIGQVAAASRLDLLICVGAKGELIADAAIAEGMPSPCVSHFPDSRTASSAIPGMLRENDLVLLKASRTIHLEIVAQAIFEAQQKMFRRAAS